MLCMQDSCIVNRFGLLPGVRSIWVWEVCTMGDQMGRDYFHKGTCLDG